MPTDLRNAIVACPAELLPELYRFRARTWISEGALPQAFPQGAWTDEHDAHRLHWVVLDEGRIVAAASLGLHRSLREVDEADAYAGVVPPVAGTVAAPARVVVDAQFRGHGIAQALLDRQEEAARGAGATLAVRQASPAMRRLLERRGWRYHRPGPADPRFPGVEFSVMSLLL